VAVSTGQAAGTRGRKRGRAPPAAQQHGGGARSGAVALQAQLPVPCAVAVAQPGASRAGRSAAGLGRAWGLGRTATYCGGAADGRRCSQLHCHSRRQQPVATADCAPLHPWLCGVLALLRLLPALLTDTLSIF